MFKQTLEHLLTTAKLERAGVSVHGEVLQLHGAFCGYGQPIGHRNHNAHIKNGIQRDR